MKIDGIEMLPAWPNCHATRWYVAAFANEESREPLYRMLCKEPIVLYRDEAGHPVALSDRCPHRGMRLSNGGMHIRDNIRGNYHGILFWIDERYRLIPSGEALRPGCVAADPRRSRCRSHRRRTGRRQPSHQAGRSKRVLGWRRPPIGAGTAHCPRIRRRRAAHRRRPAGRSRRIGHRRRRSSRASGRGRRSA